MKKYLLTIEFRYNAYLKKQDYFNYTTQKITLGVFDEREDAMKLGNKTLQLLSKYFEVREGDKFVVNHLFGNPNNMVTNVCYTTKGIQYFLSIETLEYKDLTETIESIFDAVNIF